MPNKYKLDRQESEKFTVVAGSMTVDVLGYQAKNSKEAKKIQVHTEMGIEIEMWITKQKVAGEKVDACSTS